MTTLTQPMQPMFADIERALDNSERTKQILSLEDIDNFMFHLKCAIQTSTKKYGECIWKDDDKSADMWNKVTKKTWLLRSRVVKHAADNHKVDYSQEVISTVF